MALLWERCKPLASAALPDWLEPDTAGNYRELPMRETPAGSHQGLADYAADLHALGELGLIVEDGANEVGQCRVYMAAPQPQDVWSIGLYCGGSPIDLRPSDAVRNPILSRDDVTDVTATFVADPFVVRERGMWHMFFEVMNWRSGKGEIGLAASPDGSNWDYRRIVLSEPFHLSYPHVFQADGAYFMIPESFQAGAVRLYEASDFPTVWKFRRTLIEGDYLADPSVIHHAGKWWMWVDASPTQAHDTLRLYYADELSGRWIEHPQSPIIEADPRNARPAGRVVLWNGRLLRFAQNCESAYGTDVRAFEITTLTPVHYAERPIGSTPLLGPGDEAWNAAGMHHVDPHRISHNHWIACVDGWSLER